MKKAFTLAEVLITLGIIGVVAALTLPSLMTDIGNKKLKTQFFKTYSDLNQAAKLFYTNEGASVHDVDLHLPHVGEGNNSWNSHEIMKKFMTYFKGQNKAYDEMWLYYDRNKTHIIQRNLNGSEIRYSYPCDQSMIISDISGRLFAMDDNVLAPTSLGRDFGSKICVDINGNTPPNRFGYDRFVFVFTADNEVVPYTGDEWNTLRPNVTVTRPEDEKNISKFCSRTQNTGSPAHTCAYFALKDKSPTGNGTYWKDFLKEK